MIITNVKYIIRKDRLELSLEGKEVVNKSTTLNLDYMNPELSLEMKIENGSKVFYILDKPNDEIYLLLSSEMEMRSSIPGDISILKEYSKNIECLETGAFANYGDGICDYDWAILKATGDVVLRVVYADDEAGGNAIIVIRDKVVTVSHDSDANFDESKWINIKTLDPDYQK